MIERGMNEVQFDEVKQLTKRIEELTKAREDLQTRLLEAHTTALDELKIKLTLIVDRTDGLPKVIESIQDRLTALERWKILMTGYAAAFGFIGAFVGWVTSLILRVR